MRLLLAILALAAANAQPQPSFSVDVRLVRLLVNVKNASGDLVGSLEKDQFSVYDCNVPQEIRVFERYTTKPLSIAVLVDSSGSTRIDWPVEVRAIGKFLKALFGEGNERDAAALYTFNYDVVQRDFSRNARRMENYLRLIKPEGGTSLYDAIHFAGMDLTHRDGRRVIVVVSDGGNTTSSRTFQEALESAQRADAVMYPVVIVPIENDAGRNTGGEHALQTLARSTGGRWLPATLPELDRAFSEILRDLRAQYMIGYYPHGLPSNAPAFHPVRVDLKRADLRAQTRTGYYGDESQ
ncbi:MAG TPA: VWA domain-containing protein [Bryobacteraceae bacterium]|nr:VWA domain-containing protein [Bryobacteraceae bacterium]